MRIRSSIASKEQVLSARDHALQLTRALAARLDYQSATSVLGRSGFKRRSGRVAGFLAQCYRGGEAPERSGTLGLP